MIICLCQSNPEHTVKSGSKRIHPEDIPLPNTDNEMQCIKTGASVMNGEGEYGYNCDIYMCVHCGCRVASL